MKAGLLGRYELEGEIGAGGMATVYLARDLKHNRRVAVKLLRPELGIVLGPERFLAEIQVTANLQHPNLLPLFDSGDADGLLYYVMPYVDGETLRHRLEREKQLPIDEALAIAIAVASALEYAHAHGVIHRDLKPENILLQAGQPIVADFGIALAVSNAGGQRVTQSGMSLGTPQYMSPEQATGDRAVDARADIFSLGAVVYEMLTGEPPHSARTAQATIAKLLTEEARSIATLRPAVPEYVDDAVLRSLQKLPADRFTSARSFADALQGKAYVPRPRATQAPSRNRTLVVGGSAAAAAVIVAVSFGLWRAAKASTDSARPSRYPLAFQGDAKFLSRGGVSVALSPDGSLFAYTGSGAVPRLYVKRLDEIEPKPLPGTERAVNPQFSPDGKWIAFTTAGSLKKMQLPAGVPVTIADSVDRFSWGDGDVVVVTHNSVSSPSTLWRTRASGGPVELLAEPDRNRREGNYTWPHVLPGGRVALFNVFFGASLDSAELAAIRLDDRTIVRFGILGLNPRYVSSGHLVFSHSNGAVMAAPFDAKRLRVTGAPVPVLDHVLVRAQGATQFAIARNGTLAYVNEGPGTQLVMMDRTARPRVLVADIVRRPGSVRFSPDGKRIAIHRGGAPVDANIWIYDLGSAALTQLTTDNRSMAPAWSADSRRVAWTVFGGGVSWTQWQPWDASEPSARMLDSVRETQFSATGGFVVSVGRGGWFMTTLDAARRRSKILDRDAALATVSPDGRWIAYQSRGAGAGQEEIYVQSLPGPGGRHQISENGGTAPVWGATSGELFFRMRGWLWSATIATTPEFAVVRRDSLFAMNVPAGAFYDVSRDGKNFVMPWFLGEENPPPVLVTGWFADLRERMAVAARAR